MVWRSCHPLWVGMPSTVRTLVSAGCQHTWLSSLSGSLLARQGTLMRLSPRKFSRWVGPESTVTVTSDVLYLLPTPPIMSPHIWPLFLYPQDVKFTMKLDVYDFCSPSLQEKLLPARTRFKEVEDKKAVSLAHIATPSGQLVALQLSTVAGFKQAICTLSTLIGPESKDDCRGQTAGSQA